MEEEVGENPLLKASREGDLEMLKSIIANDANVNMQTHTQFFEMTWKDETALMLACTYGHYEIVEYLLLQCQASANLENEDGQTAFVLASECGHFEILKLLFENVISDVHDVQVSEALLVSSQLGHLNIVEYLVENNADINFQNEEGETALMLASEYGKIDIVRYLVGKCAKANIENEDGNTALALAIDQGDFDIFTCLTQDGYCNYSIQQLNQYLLLASEGGYFEIVEYLIQEGAEVDFENEDGITSLMLASSEGHLDVVFLLMENGAKLDHQDSYGDTAMILATEEGFSEIVKALLETGVNFDLANQAGDTPLLLASRLGFSIIVMDLLEAGFQVDVQNDAGDNALIEASQEGHLDIVEKLLLANARVDLQNKKTGDTCITVALQDDYDSSVKINTMLDCMKIVNMLVNKGCNLDSQNMNGDTALIWACHEGNEELVYLLLEKGAKINLFNKDGDTALMIAAQEGLSDTVQILVENGADIDVTNINGETALAMTCPDYDFIIRFLIEKGANIDCRNQEGETPLLMAVRDEVVHYEGLEILVEYLVEKGADLDLQNQNGDSALLIACQEGLGFISEYLIEKGAEVNLQNNQGDSTLILAVIGHNRDIVSDLLDNGANLTLQNNNGDTAFMCASQMRGEWDLDMMECLFEESQLNLQNRDGETSLMIACSNGDLEVVQYLTGKGANTHIKNLNGDTALTLACIEGYFDVVKFLMDLDVNQQQGSINHALVLTSESGYFEIVEYLLEKGADVNFQDEEGNTPLILASQQGDINLVEMLMKHGASLNIKNKHGYTAVISAASVGHLEVLESLLNNTERDQNELDISLQVAIQEDAGIRLVKYLVKNGAQLDFQNEEGDTALILACRSGFYAIVKYLLKRGSPVSLQNKFGNSALMIACQAGHSAVVQCLTQSPEMKFDLRNQDGFTAMDLACQRGFLRIVKYLTPFHRDVIPGFMMACQEGKLSVIKYLVKNGVPIDCQNEDGNTALTLASQEGQEEIVEYLLSEGAFIDFQDRDGDSGLILACNEGRVEVVKILVENGANVDLRNKDGETALNWASQLGHLEIVKILVEHDAEIDLQNKEGMTSLMLSCETEQIEVVKYFLRNGASLDLKNHKGFTAFSLLNQRYHEEVTRCLGRHFGKTAAVEGRIISKENEVFQTFFDLASQVHEFLVYELPLLQKLEALPNFEEYIQLSRKLEQLVETTCFIPNITQAEDLKAAKGRDRLRRDLIDFLKTSANRSEVQESREGFKSTLNEFNKQVSYFQSLSLENSSLINEDNNPFAEQNYAKKEEIHEELRKVCTEGIELGETILNWYEEISQEKEKREQEFEMMKLSLYSQELIVSRQNLAFKCIEEAKGLKNILSSIATSINDDKNEEEEEEKRRLQRKQLKEKDQELRNLCIDLSASNENKLHCDFPELFYTIYNLIRKSEKISKLKTDLLTRNLLLEVEIIAFDIPANIRELIPIQPNIVLRKVNNNNDEDDWKVWKWFSEKNVQNMYRALTLPRRIHHPNILVCEGVVVEHQDFVWLQYPLLLGGNLLHWLRQRERTMLIRLRIISQVLNSLMVLHENKIVHRDLKPENVLMTSENDDEAIPKIADFDVAKDLSTSHVTKTTVKGGIGTIGYMAPELLLLLEEEEEKEKRPPIDYILTDIYALSATIVVVLVFNGNLRDIPKGFDLYRGLELKSEYFEKELTSVVGKENAKGIISFLKKGLSKEPKDRPKLDEEVQQLFSQRFCLICQDLHKENEGILCPSHQHFYCRKSFHSLVENATNTLDKDGVEGCYCYSCRQEFKPQFLASNLSEKVFHKFWDWNRKKLEMEVLKEENARAVKQFNEALKLTKFEYEVQQAVHHICNDIMISKCPSCNSAWEEKEDDTGQVYCRAIYCHYCRNEFCYFCNMTLKEDTHRHVANCSLNPVIGSVFLQKQIYEKYLITRRIKMFKDYFDRLSSKEVKLGVKKNPAIIDVIARLGIHMDQL